MPLEGFLTVKLIIADVLCGFIDGCNPPQMELENKIPSGQVLASCGPPLSLQIVLVAHSQTHCLTFFLWLLCNGAAACVCGLLASDINLLALFMKGLPTPAVHS